MKKKEELLASGKKIYNLSVGTPDFPVFDHIRKALVEAAQDPEKYHYTLRDLPELHEAVKDYYKKRFDVEISTDEIVAVPGSQEGVAHLGLTLCNPGDVVLLPNPGYPVFEVGAYLGGAELYFYELREENDFLPKFDEIPEDIARRAKYIMVSYPYNPGLRRGSGILLRGAGSPTRKNTTSSSSTTTPTRISSMTASGAALSWNFPGRRRSASSASPCPNPSI